MNSKAKKILKGLGIGTATIIVLCLVGGWMYRTSAHTRVENLREALRADGLAITPGDLKIVIPPDAENAAVQYRALMTLLKNNPLSANDSILNMGYSSVGAPPEEIAQLRSAVQNRQDVLSLLHSATRLEKCGFQRDWSLGPMIIFPEFATLRSATRMLVAESELMMADGKPLNAIRNMDGGYHIARHASTEPILIGKLVGIACDAITLRELETILQRAGDRLDVALAVANSVEKNFKPIDMSDAMRGETMSSEIYCDMIRKKPGDAYSVFSSNNFGSGNSSDDEQLQQAVARLLAPFWVAMLLDANECNLLLFDQRAYHAMKLPYRESVAEADRLQKELDKNEHNPAYTLVSIFSPAFSESRQKQEQIVVQASVLRASALVMAYRDKNGRFPDTLAEAMNPVPVDPYSDQPLQYRVDPKRKGFHIFAVGKTGKFDGGTAGIKPESSEVVIWYPMPEFRVKGLAEIRLSNKKAMTKKK